MTYALGYSFLETGRYTHLVDPVARDYVDYLTEVWGLDRRTVETMLCDLALLGELELSIERSPDERESFIEFLRKRYWEAAECASGQR